SSHAAKDYGDCTCAGAGAVCHRATRTGGRGTQFPRHCPSLSPAVEPVRPFAESGDCWTPAAPPSIIFKSGHHRVLVSGTAMLLKAIARVLVKYAGNAVGFGVAGDA